MRLRIISDGTPGGSRVVNAETGELVERVTRVELAGDYRGFTGIIYVRQVEVDVVADLARAEPQEPEHP